MPGPLRRDASNDLALFESCEDVQEAWGGYNGNFSNESLYHECNNKHFQTTSTTTTTITSRSQCVNGEEETTTTSHTQKVTSTAMATSSQSQSELEGERDSPEEDLGSERHTPEDMELEEEETEEEPVETINVPVVEASLSVDISKSLTRHKISSVQHGRTLSFADKDDSMEAPTRRPRTPSHATDCVEPPGGAHTRLVTRPDTPKNGKVPPSAHRTIRVVRNPSYHFAVRDAAVASPQHTPSYQPQAQQQQQQHMPRVDDTSLKQTSKSCDSSPTRDTLAMQTVMEDLQAVEISSMRLGSVGDDDMTTYLSESLAANNMPRSVSFSGPESLSPDLLARPRGSISAGNSRSGSVSQLSATLLPSDNTTAATSHTRDKTSTSFVRGSVITRSFRRLFSQNPRPQAASGAFPQKEDLWLDIPEPHINIESDVKSPSRLRKISTNLSRRLSNRSTNKMATSPGANGQYLFPNGATSPEDVSSLVEYDDLLKLFCCSGCQGFMTPPLYQCRKGHLVCNTCRFSLKQVCPMCKQRFAENTNMMMEQVCNLVKFPCKYAAQGCPEFHLPRNKQDHEHFCAYRPVHCHHGQRGCPKVLLLRDMHEHLDQCEYKAK